MRPNIVLVLADDMGYSDIGCYGGEISTPNLDRLAAGGVRLTQFYNTARCSPSRASLLTGLHPHQTGIGILTNDDRPEGYAGTINDRCATIAEILGSQGYSTYMSGKWHLTGQLDEPDDSWPTRRGFQHFFGTLLGAGDYWNPGLLMRQETNIEHEALADPDFFYTDAISNAAVDFVRGHDATQPFFMYVPYTAPHWPLHAREEDSDRYRGRFDAGWDQLRVERLRRMTEMGIIDESWALSDRDPEVRAWDDTDHRDWETRRMEVYAAQVEQMDRGIGRIVDALEKTGQLDNTIVIFLSDNGGCAEELAPKWADEIANLPPHMRTHTRDGERIYRGNTPDVTPGPESTFASYGRCWANLSNTPFREYKHWVHEGGIATPLIAHWPAGLQDTGVLRHGPHQLTDMVPTLLEITGVPYPTSLPGRDPLPLEGVSMLSTLQGGESPSRYLYWEHEGNAAVRRDQWKLVCKYPGDWELYDIHADRTELHNLAAEQPDVVAELSQAYDTWAERCGVIPRDGIITLYRERAKHAETRPARS